MYFRLYPEGGTAGTGVNMNSKVTPETVVDGWKQQLEHTIKPYLSLALPKGQPLQVVLSLKGDGTVGSPKVTIYPPT